MVWSDQSQFPFYVIDNNGNIILTIDETGLHLKGSAGTMDAEINTVGQPTLFFNNAAGTSQAFINAPNFSGVTTMAMDTGPFTDPQFPGHNLRALLFLTPGESRITYQETALVRDIGGIVGCEPSFAFIGYNDINGNHAGGYFQGDDVSALIQAMDTSNRPRVYLFLDEGTSPSNPSYTLALQDVSGNNYSQIFADASGIAFSSKPNTNWQPFYNPSTQWLAVKNVPEANLILGSGWTATATYNTPTAMLCPDGWVKLSGTITAGTTADNTNIFNVPNNLYFPPASALLRPATSTGNANCRLLVNTSGQVFVYGCAAAAQLGLDGLQYKVLSHA